MKTSVFGCGAWGIALSLLLRENGHDVTLWDTPELAAALNETRENPRLPGVMISPEIIITHDIDAAADAEIAVLATASYQLRDTAARLRGQLRDDTVIVCGSKGIDADSGLRFSDLLRGEFGDGARIVAMLGPSHAEEVARRIPTAVVAASRNRDAAEKAQDAFMNEHFRVYTTPDVVGAEIGAAMKNVIALCVGICDGLGYGDNTMAMLVTRGLSEIAALAEACGGRSETVSGLAGMGDLIVTCLSKHSRNRSAGVLIGKGRSTDAAMKEVGAVVEGYYAAAAARVLSERAGVEMPICAKAYHVLYEGGDPREAIRSLMLREKKSEDERW